MEKDNENGYSLKRGEGTQINFRGTTMTMKVVGEQTDGAYSLIEMLHPAHVGPALHIHPRGTKAFYVLNGSYRIRFGISRTPPHQMTLSSFRKAFPIIQWGREGGTVLVISPTGLEQYFSEVAEVLSTQLLSWDVEQEIARRHGPEFLEQLKHWGQ